MGADIVRDLHFGGGAGKLDGGEEDAEADGKVSWQCTCFIYMCSSFWPFLCKPRDLGQP